MTEIEVVRTEDADPLRFTVRVADERSVTEHDVTLARADAGRLGSGRSPEELVRASFAFLLEREPKEQILRSFDLTEIGRYFSEFERTISSNPD